MFVGRAGSWRAEIAKFPQSDPESPPSVVVAPLTRDHILRLYRSDGPMGISPLGRPPSIRNA